MSKRFQGDVKKARKIKKVKKYTWDGKTIWGRIPKGVKTVPNKNKTSGDER